MNPADWCPFHGSDGDVCDCRVEDEPVPKKVITIDASVGDGYFYCLNNAEGEPRCPWRTPKTEAGGWWKWYLAINAHCREVHGLGPGPEPEPMPTPIYEEW